MNCNFTAKRHVLENMWGMISVMSSHSVTLILIIFFMPMCAKHISIKPDCFYTLWPLLYTQAPSLECVTRTMKFSGDSNILRY